MVRAVQYADRLTACGPPWFAPVDPCRNGHPAGVLHTPETLSLLNVSEVLQTGAMESVSKCPQPPAECSGPSGSEEPGSAGVQPANRPDFTEEQFSLEAEDILNPDRFCRACRTPLPRTSRRDRKTCSLACRIRMHRTGRPAWEPVTTATPDAGITRAASVKAKSKTPSQRA